MIAPALIPRRAGDRIKTDLEPLRARVQRLRCFRGIDDLTALTIAAELGDPRRFATAPRTMACVGLVSSEHSSTAKRAQGGITKLATPISAASSWNRPGTIAIIRSSARRFARGKSRPHIVTAVARELTGVVWAALTQ